MCLAICISGNVMLDYENSWPFKLFMFTQRWGFPGNYNTGSFVDIKRVFLLCLKNSKHNGVAVCVWTMTFLGFRHQQRSGCKTWSKGKVCLSWCGAHLAVGSHKGGMRVYSLELLSRSNTWFVCSFSCCNELIGVPGWWDNKALQQDWVPSDRKCHLIFWLIWSPERIAEFFCGQQDLDVIQH